MEGIKPSSGYQIHGFTVKFPHDRKPFAAQMAVIAKVLQALKEGKNALLESPTGTGKTLALLSSSLAYQESFRLATYQDSPPESEAIDPQAGAEMTKVSMRVPTIYYCTRTHSQLKQIIKEFKDGHYDYVKDAKMCVLGSRAHLCINDTAKAEAAAGKALEDVCQALRDSSSCKFARSMNQSERVAESLREEHVWDIEDAIAAGKKLCGCPFYATKSLLDRAEYILLPYNYILDPGIRKTMKLNLKRSVVILDEAHNIEDVARDGASLNTVQSELSTVVGELARLTGQFQQYQYCSRLLDLIVSLQEWIGEMADDLFDGGSEGTATFAGGFGGTPAAKRPIATGARGSGFFVSPSQTEEARGQCVWEGGEFLQIVGARMNLSAATLPVYQSLLEQLIEQQEALKAAANEDAANPSGSSLSSAPAKLASGEPLISTATIMLLRKYLMVLTFMFKQEQRFADDYRIVIQRIDDSRAMGLSSFDKRRRTSGNTFASSRKFRPVSFHMWCMTGEVVFSDIATETHSIILTSGTLSPLDAFASELGIPFPVKLEAGHVINLSKQLFAGCFRSVGDQSLLSTYQAQQSSNYLDTIGRALLLVVHLTPGGVLLFVPSYRLLQRLQEHWAARLLGEIRSQCQANVYFEPKDSTSMNAMLEKYYRDLSRPGSKAAMVAVCRGKVSEGINFSDHFARAVITVGIPFPSVGDLQVQLKRSYQDQRVARLQSQRQTACQGSSQSSCQGGGGGDGVDAASQSSQLSRSLSALLQSATGTPLSMTPSSTGTPAPVDGSSASASASAAAVAAQYPNAVAKAAIDGNLWYKQQAFRAINQAIGRCIRHRNDFGAILLLDPRFSQDNIIQHLSRWMRSEIQPLERLEEAVVGMRTFFQQHDSYARVKELAMAMNYAESVKAERKHLPGRGRDGKGSKAGSEEGNENEEDDDEGSGNGKWKGNKRDGRWKPGQRPPSAASSSSQSRSARKPAARTPSRGKGGKKGKEDGSEGENEEDNEEAAGEEIRGEGGGKSRPVGQTAAKKASPGSSRSTTSEETGSASSGTGSATPSANQTATKPRPNIVSSFEAMRAKLKKNLVSPSLQSPAALAVPVVACPTTIDLDS